MAYIECTYQKDVTHIGFLQNSDDRKSSLDGPGISVSTKPESWRAINGMNGPELILSFRAGQWVDAMTFSDDDMESIQQWALQEGYIRTKKCWHAFVEKQGDMLPQPFISREAAAQSCGRTLGEEVTAFEQGQGACWEEVTEVITARGMRDLERWPSEYDQWQQAMIIIYVRRVVVPKRPYVVGVWWSEPDRPDMGVAPSGILFPERLHHFEVENEEGDFGQFNDIFPDFNAPQDPLVKFE